MISDADGKPIPPTIPPGVAACANCLWAAKHEQDNNFDCFADPPRIISSVTPSPIKGMPPQTGFISLRPAVQPQHCCRHFTPRPQQLPAEANG
jgi:hypothetical protein